MGVRLVRKERVERDAATWRRLSTSLEGRRGTPQATFHVDWQGSRLTSDGRLFDLHSQSVSPCLCGLPNEDIHHCCVCPVCLQACACAFGQGKLS
jgi:hypothetical protein